MNNMNPTDKDAVSKKEINANSSSSRHWSNFKNPRIVRVSRSFGGKDRHSKVCTVRGLRDRRIRLSVQTAIQLYDLQERLGLSQPSKVVDWLLDVARHDINKLPPLPMVPGLYAHDHHQSTLISSSLEPPALNISLSTFLTSNDVYAKENKLREVGFGGFVGQNLLPYNDYNSWDQPNLSLSQFGGGFCFTTQTNEAEKLSHSNFSSSSALPLSSQGYLCPSANILPATFPTFSSSTENDHLRQIYNFLRS